MAILRDSLTYTPTELVFGTSGLRGLVTDMTDLECYINTRGFMNFLTSNSPLSKEGPVYVAGDLRDSTARIMASVCRAVRDAGLEPINCGQVPTPAVTYYGMQHERPSIMVTGSHIPADRNGIKFNKPTGEVLKDDEINIKTEVFKVRQMIYDLPLEESHFNERGEFVELPELPPAIDDAAESYMARYTQAFGPLLSNQKIVFYQHSAVGRDLLPAMLQGLGAEVTTVGRSTTFIPIDSENVTENDQHYFKKLAGENPGIFAIISTDGDSDRPFVIDEKGVFHRGDELGSLVASWLEADSAAVPISSSDSISDYLQSVGIDYTHTRIGSPYVIKAMTDTIKSGRERVVGWEVNGGFLLGADIKVAHGVLKSLPTRDAILPIIAILAFAARESTSLSVLFSRLPARFTSAGLIDNFPFEAARKIVNKFSSDSPEILRVLERYFSPSEGFGKPKSINTVDGVRIFFDNGDITHLRPSGNAPQMRIYSVADSQSRADEIVRLAIAEPNGIIRRLENAYSAD